MKKYFIIFLLFTYCFSKGFTIASYNVENFFDLKNDGTEYKEYILTKNSYWNKKAYNIKLDNIVKVIKDLNPDILALQEIESINVLNDLKKRLPQYSYKSFFKYKNSSVGIAFLSKIKILYNKKIDVKFDDKIFRPIMETTFYFKNLKFKIFNHHWSSKRSKESYRVKYAYTLLNRLRKLPKNLDYIILGDLNENYNEKETLYLNKKLNDTSNITGINDILNTSIKNSFITKKSIKNIPNSHYNLWLELPYNSRFSYKFRGNNTTPDNIIIPKALFDDKNISYVDHSFNVYKPKYLYNNKKINKWNIKKAKGFSDHLPIFAKFDTKKYKHKPQNIVTIKDLYKIEQLYKPAILKNVVVIYKNGKNAIIKQKNNRAIFVYNGKYLKNNFTYDIKVSSIKNFYGLKEIINMEIIKEKGKNDNIEALFLHKNKDLFNLSNQNEVVKNLKIKYKNKYGFYGDKKIRIYIKDKKIKLKNNINILLKKAHLGYFKNNVQLIIYKKSDFEVLK